MDITLILPRRHRHRHASAPPVARRSWPRPPRYRSRGAAGGRNVV